MADEQQTPQDNGTLFVPGNDSTDQAVPASPSDSNDSNGAEVNGVGNSETAAEAAPVQEAPVSDAPEAPAVEAPEQNDPTGASADVEGAASQPEGDETPPAV